MRRNFNILRCYFVKFFRYAGPIFGADSGLRRTHSLRLGVFDELSTLAAGYPPILSPHDQRAT